MKSDKQICRSGVDFGKGADLLDDAPLHHDNFCRQRHRLNLVMCDIDHRRMQILMQLLDLRAHLNTQFGVKIRQRLVKKTVLGHRGWQRAGAGHRTIVPDAVKQGLDLQLNFGQLGFLASLVDPGPSCRR